MKTEIINKIYSIFKKQNVPSGYLPSIEEAEVLKRRRLNRWERDFLTQIRCGLEHDTLKNLSDKQTNALNKIFKKTGEV